MRIETTILGNLLQNEEYTRKVLPFLKTDYFTNNDEKIVIITTGIRTKKPKTITNLLVIFDPTYPRLFAIQILTILLKTLKQRQSSSTRSITNIVMAIFGVDLKNGNEFVKTKNVTTENINDKKSNKKVNHLFTVG